MTEKLKGVGVDVGHPLPSTGLHANRERGRVGRLTPEKGDAVERVRKFKVEEGQEMIRRVISPARKDSDHAFNIAPNLLHRGFTAHRLSQKWAGDIR
jgi:putative transposase